MKPEPHDPILDACLEEILGGHTPPDLSDSILEHWQQLNQALPADMTDPVEPTENLLQTSTQQATNLATPVATILENPASVRDSLDQEYSTGWSRWARYASILTIGACLGLIAFKLYPPGKPAEPGIRIAENNPELPAKKQTSSADSNTLDKPPAGLPLQTRPSIDAITGADTSVTPENPPKLPAPLSTEVTPETLNVFSRTRPAKNQDIVSHVNQQLATSWKTAKLVPSPKATDAEWCRRVYLRLLGRIPTKQELDRFVTGKSATDKRTALVNQLLEGDQYRKEYARHWTTIWTNLLIGRRGGLGRGDLASREGLQQYLQAGFETNKPYDQIAYELISATGSNRPGSTNFNGAVNFMLANMNNHGTLATSRTSRVFMGKQLQCVQCHKHPNNNWAQQHFWEMNAFFQQVHVERDKASNTTLLVNRDFIGKQGNPDEAEIYFNDADGAMRVAYPRFPGGKPLRHNGQVDQFDRRTELARLVQQSDDLSRSLVNRTWAHFLGFGFTRPVDDMGHHNPPSHPELLEHLAGQFVAHGYDLKDLFRWITLSDAFSLSSRLSDANASDTPELGQAPQFSRYYTRPMQPEEVYQSLLVVAGQDRSKSSPGELEQARRDWLSQFARKLGTDEGDESNLFAGNIHQSLVIMNGSLMEQATDADTRSVLARVLESKMKTPEKVEHLFLTAVARRPTKRELKLVQQMMEKSTPEQMLQDIWWALLNSNEFILDH